MHLFITSITGSDVADFKEPLPVPLLLSKKVYGSSVSKLVATIAAPTAILIVEFLRLCGIPTPAPFFLVFLALLLGTAFGGLRYGLWNWVFCAGYVFYATYTGFGPERLIDNYFYASVSAILTLIITVIVGQGYDSYRALFSELRDRESQILDANEKLEQRVADRTRELRHVSNSMLTAVEHERRHIAGELHDQLGQTATALKLSLHMLGQKSDNPRAVESLARCETMIESIISHIRNMALALRPPMLDTLGLEDTLRWFIEEQIDLGLPIELQVDELSKRPNPATETACFRIAQESLTNIIRHAGATMVSVRLYEDQNDLVLIVEDNGCGFDVAEVESRASEGVTFGVTGMSERARLAGGNLSITSSADHGTRVCAEFPNWANVEMPVDTAIAI